MTLSTVFAQRGSQPLRVYQATEISYEYPRRSHEAATQPARLRRPRCAWHTQHTALARLCHHVTARSAAAPAAAELAISANCVFCPDGAGIVGGVLVTLTLAARAQPHLESRHYGIKASKEG